MAFKACLQERESANRKFESRRTTIIREHGKSRGNSDIKWLSKFGSQED